MDKKKTQTEIILEIVSNRKLILFHNPQREPYVRIPVDDHWETWACKSKMFKRWISKEFFNQEDKAPNTSALSSALQAIEGIACFQGEQYELFNRVAWLKDEIWYDLCDDKWRAVKINSEGWEVVDNPPVLFRRYGHQSAQALPVKGGKVSDFLDYINVDTNEAKLLLQVLLVSFFIPGFPHPIPYLYGQQGAVKSVACMFIKSLVDPSALAAFGFPRDNKELAQQLSHHWLLVFDNISYLPDWVSDLLCVAVTGGGFPKRELYSDEEDIIFSFQRSIVINGINLLITKPDLFDRSVLFELERVPETQRKDLSKIINNFDTAKPAMLGAIFDIVSQAMKTKSAIQLLKLPRMADFVLWGCAIAEALGYDKEQFLAAYYTNINTQNAQVIHSNSLAEVLLLFMEGRDIWEGTPSELLEGLRQIASEHKVNYEKESDFPKAANVLSRKLSILKTNLATAGLDLIKDDTALQRRWIIKKNTVSTVIDANDDTDDVFQVE